jgi:hypothetical protein
MKKLTISLLAVLGLVGTSFAGHEMASGKEYKGPPAPEPCFKDRELQFDVFGEYAVGEGPNQVGLFREHGWGGGVGINYFFTRNIGIGVDASWLDAEESTHGVRHHENDRVNDFINRHIANNNDTTAIHNFTGSLIFRFPMDAACLAPYVYVGGGCHVDGDQWASAHAGVGLEYRIVPSKVGLFADGRWTYLGDRFGNNDLNFFQTRLGVRLVF